MDALVRWYASEGDGVPWVVIQVEGEGEDGGMHSVIAECDEQVHAEEIAAALNNHQRAEAVSEAARVYFREFDHLIGNEDYPERRDLREALTGLGGNK